MEFVRGRSCSPRSGRGVRRGPAIDPRTADMAQIVPARTNIRFMFHAMVTRFHSPRTLSRPRSRHCRNPSTDLILPNTGSGVWRRWPGETFPSLKYPLSFGAWVTSAAITSSARTKPSRLPCFGQCTQSAAYGVETVGTNGFFESGKRPPD